MVWFGFIFKIDPPKLKISKVFKVQDFYPILSAGDNLF